ncbi:protein translocase subunit SecA-like [Tachysurus vachellii]|uniref:protein translocase subunit SecA-like n=1 Tax=Tachysurus vachellii TaxID=175792 RepID=UPI00296B2434|nr:protein translocase subunit SecA-like [Tachysurus vachellii]XP_060720312.1 protein translocase subunit SecA-like [Tachysurus vachellii]XP_060720313.1 protein translocase subunit SecA-like [Tachysurus vachellii]XP_060720314.1 protein translocase subunit SecA-like [Tachysurus vachellii]XP_060720315.1 protein translocase subunit SecA-like [Tachysurus vachellii]
MASTNLLLSRLRDLVRYGQWSEDDVVDLFTALVKEYGVKRLNTDFYTWMAKILYQVEIHKINKSDLSSEIKPNQFVDDIENRIKSLAKETREKSLKEILEEIRTEGDTDLNICEVENIVSYVSSSPVSKNPSGIKETLMRLCNAVEKAKGWKPRLTQMVSWCIMALSDSSRLIQVGTGEGKSCIVAMFAAYLAMNRQHVDIISSSPVLAERDTEEWLPFYKNLGITVDYNTNKRKVEDLRRCYACQVVYGTAQDFAGDWLRHRFQRENVRPDRKFECVIVDEVDSLMLDKGLEIVYLNSEMPVMESLNVILAKIWCVVNQSEDLDVEKTLDLIRSLLASDDLDILPSHLEISTSTSEREHNKIHIPGFLEHINERLKIWIENAFLAKTMTLGHEYIQHENGVVPVDFRSTGVVQNNMKWGDGLQQFLEMKHQTRLSNMSIITNFKSNVSLFRSYKQIYGLTGTLGKQNELDLLQKLYPGIKSCKIPPFRRRKLYEKDGIVITDEDGWVETICKVVNNQVNPTVYRGSRAVLVICETIKRAQTVHDALSKTIPTDKLKLYTNNNMDNSMITGKEVTEGCVIVATNLAGRGTDLKVCKNVNDSGGLFVVQTFLPLNIRVEQQAFGRTAREGNPGSAQLIMCSTHFSESVKLVMELHSPLGLLTLLRHLTATLAVTGLTENKFEETLTIYQGEHNEKNCEAMVKELRKLLNAEKPSGLTNLEVEKQSRDLIVQTRLSHILEDDIPKITKKEDLFSDYLAILDTIYKQPLGGNHEDIVSSLHECWGMWLLMKFNENESTEILRQQLKKDLQSAKQKLDCKQSPSTMIYHYVRLGNTLRNKRSFADSIEMYTRAIENNSCCPAIALYNRALSILSKGNSGHIAQALSDLKKAEEAVDSYMRKLTLTVDFVKSSSNDHFLFSDTSFTKQFYAKQMAQHRLKKNIQQAIQVLQFAESKGYDVRITDYPAELLVLNPVLLRSDEIIKVLRSVVALSKVSSTVFPESLSISSSTENELMDGVTELGREIIQLQSLGLDTLFSVQTVFSFFKRLSKIFS